MEVVDVKTTREMECSSVRVRDIFDMSSSSLCTFRTDGVCVLLLYWSVCARERVFTGRYESLGG